MNMRFCPEYVHTLGNSAVSATVAAGELIYPVSQMLTLAHVLILHADLVISIYYSPFETGDSVANTRNSDMQGVATNFRLGRGTVRQILIQSKR